MKNIEIERKFLVDKSKLPPLLEEGTDIQQGYVFNSDNGVLRVRSKGDKYYLTVKNKPEFMLSKIEIEFVIEKEQAVVLFSMTNSTISKTRYEIDFKGKTWEVDFFKDLNGFVLAEIELESEDEEFEKPEWCTLEVTEDVMFQNSNLIKVNKNDLMNHANNLKRTIQ